MSAGERWGSAFALLLIVSVLALFLHVTTAPWYCWALVWLFAVKWILVLVLDFPPDAPRSRASK